MTGLFLGVDVGSTTVKAVAVDGGSDVLTQRYRRSNGRPRATLLKVLADLGADIRLDDVEAVGVTGSGGGPVAPIIGARHFNELITQTRALGEYHPEARTVVEIGGQDSKFLSLEWDPQLGRMTLLDFAMNTLCAAGTGAFLDQQAERLGLSVETDFQELALESTSPARIAGRCTVFAKSDMIHLQQKGTPLPDILAGLSQALARNFKSVIGKGKTFVPPVVFQGGVAYNRAVARAFQTVLELEPGELVVPQQHAVMAAIGAALIAREEAALGEMPDFLGVGALEEAVRTRRPPSRSLPVLAAETTAPPAQPLSPAVAFGGGRVPVFVGIDVGSISTNAVLVDEDGGVVARRYLPTAGRPLEAVRRALHEIGAEVGDRVEVVGAGTTGSGRYLTADFVGADTVRNEITAQGRAAVHCDPDVDTIFEIGGQDSKYIRLDRGAVVDFAMNSACAAGTGSFLEEQAGRLEIDIERDFSDLAFSSAHPTGLGDRCTVFMESDLVHHQQHGAEVRDLTAGLAYSIAQNYLNRVVDGREIGDHVYFQGGVAWNRSVVSAFRALTGRDVRVPPHHDVMGAIGVALLARDELDRDVDDPTTFRGFDLQERTYETSSFECRACPNICEVSRITMAGDPPIFYGARCDRFEEAGRKRDIAAGIPDLFAERNAMLVGDFVEPASRRNGRLRVAMPRTLILYDTFPFWRTFLEALDVELVVSAPTTPVTVRATQQNATVEACFPVKLVYGHVRELLDVEADYLFMPSVLTRENPPSGQQANRYCPYIPAVPHMVASALDDTETPPVLAPVLDLQWDQPRRDGLLQLARPLGVSHRRVRSAMDAAATAQASFYTAVRQRGRDVLESLDDGPPAVVIVGRPYNVHDRGASLDLPHKLRKLGVLPIPLDLLPLEYAHLRVVHDNMFWRSGQDMLAAADLIAADPRLNAIYLTNFNCGPDSFLLSFFRRRMKGKPFLELEVDDHTADAGVVTRCEAFLDSLRPYDRRSA